MDLEPGTAQAEVTVQLRQYFLEHGRQAEFVAWWRRAIVPLREGHGFRIAFAYLDDESAEFVWAVERNGNAAEFAEADEAYNADPERLAVIATAPPGALKRIVARLVTAVR